MATPTINGSSFSRTGKRHIKSSSGGGRTNKKNEHIIFLSALSSFFLRKKTKTDHHHYPNRFVFFLCLFGGGAIIPPFRSLVRGFFGSFFTKKELVTRSVFHSSESSDRCIGRGPMRIDRILRIYDRRASWVI